MSELKLRRAFEKHLETLTPILPTAWENITFNIPENRMWQRLTMTPSESSILSVGENGTNKIEGLCQIDVFDIAGLGMANIEKRIDNLIRHFSRKRLREDDLNVVCGAPSKANGLQDTNWCFSIVTIPYFATIGVEGGGSGGSGGDDPTALKKAANLSDLSDKSTGRSNLDVYSKTETDHIIDMGVAPIKTELAELDDRVGPLNDLSTVDKTNIVGALNEVGQKVGDSYTKAETYTKTETDHIIDMGVAPIKTELAELDDRVGPLNDLSTVDKTNIVGALNEVGQKVGDSYTKAETYTKTETDHIIDMGVAPIKTELAELDDRVGPLNDLSTVDKTNIVGALNEVGQKVGDSYTKAETYTKTETDHIIDMGVAPIKTELAELDDRVGPLNDLSTVDKTNIVGALNEVGQKVGDSYTKAETYTKTETDHIIDMGVAPIKTELAELDDRVGPLNDLSTVDKTNIVGALNEVGQKVGDSYTKAETYTKTETDHIIDMGVAPIKTGASGVRRSGGTAKRP